MKKYTLWEEKEISTIDKMTLYEPITSEWEKWENILNTLFIVPELQEVAKPLLHIVSRPSVQILTHQASLKEASSILRILQGKANKPKADWLQLVAFFLSNQYNLAQYIQTLDENEIAAWKLIISKLYVNNRMLKEATGKDWITRKESWGYYYDYLPCQEASWFKIIKSNSDRLDKYGHYREIDAYLFLLPDFRKLFAPLFFPEVDIILKSHEELPAQGLFTFNGEADFLRCFPILQALYNQGILIMGKNKMLATTKFPNMVPVLLPDINGIKSNKLYNSTIGELIMDAILALTTTPAGWIAVDDIVKKLLIYPIGENSLQVFRPYQLEELNLANKTTGEYVHLGNLTEQLGIPFLKGLFFLMGGLGMLELAYEYPSYVTSSVFNTLQYIRLTELGKYALGLVPTYTPPVVEKKKLFHLDSDRLLIHSLIPGNPYESMLQDTSISIGNHRFVMNSDSFLKNCKTEKDVNDKIDFFKQFICQDNTPEIWTEFFESLLNQCHPLKKVSRNNYIIYRLDGNNKELIRLLTTDSVLKAIIVRAEGYMILVEAKNQKKLVDRLKTYGYLL